MPDTRINPNNWKEEADKIHRHCLNNMGITPGSFKELVFLSMALGGEVGELQNIVKKMMRDGKSADQYENLFKEVADIRIYLHHLMTSCLQMSEDIVCADKLEEVRQRDWVRSEHPTSW